MRLLPCALLAASFLLAPLAHADSTFYFTLTAYSGNAGAGAGSLTVNTPPSTSSGVTTYYTSPATPGQGLLESLNFSHRRRQLQPLQQSQELRHRLLHRRHPQQPLLLRHRERNRRPILMTSALTYSFADSGKDELEIGTISTSITPEPSSLSLLATGLLSGGVALRRRLS